MNSVCKCNCQEGNKYKEIKELSFKIKDMSIAKEEFNIINNYYKENYFDNSGKEIRLRCIVENALYKNINSSNVIKSIDLEDFNFNKMTFLVFYCMYISKKTDSIIKKYFAVLSKLGLSRGCFKRFVAIYIIMKYSSFENCMLDEMILTDCEKSNLRFLLNNSKKSINKLKFDSSYSKVIRIIEGYIYLTQTIIYDDDVLKSILVTKNRIILYSKEFGCESEIERIVDKKIKIFKSSFVSNSDLKSVKRFRFKSSIVQNTVFIKSKLDKWYVDVDKEMGECVLYHENDGYQDKYHYQKTFNTSKLYNVFKYIKDHDEYCLRKNILNER